MRLKELRKERNITQAELAKKLKTSQKNISNYENNEENQCIELLNKIADYFDVSIDYLLERQQKNKLDMSNLSETQRNIINIVCQLNEIQSNRVEGFALAKLDEQEEMKQQYSINLKNN